MGNAELRELLDHREITQLVDRLGLWLDEKRFDEARSILTEGAMAETPGGTARGLEAVVEQARRNHGEEVGTQHVITNKVIDLEGDRATVGANLIATLLRSGTTVGAATPARRALRLRGGQNSRWMAHLKREDDAALDARRDPAATEGTTRIGQ
jgi:SnoaL-like domain